MRHPRRSAAPNVQPPPSGDPEVEFDLDVSDTIDELRTHRAFAAVSMDGSGIPTGPSINGGRMRTRPGIDDEEHDTEPTGWVMPEWE